jgi:hypothetical protein
MRILARWFKAPGRFLSACLRPLLVSLACLAAVFLTAHAVVQVESLWKPNLANGDDSTYPRVGDAAPDFTLKDVDGREFRLRDFVGLRPVVLEFVNITWPFCTVGQFDSKSEKLAAKYRDRAEFVLIYCRETLPDTASWLPARSQTHTWSERAERAAEFGAASQTSRRILVDQDGDDCVLDKFAGIDHLFVVIDRSGRVSFKKRKGYTDHLDDFLEGQSSWSGLSSNCRSHKGGIMAINKSRVFFPLGSLAVVLFVGEEVRRA